MWNKIGEWLDYPQDWCDLLWSFSGKLLKYFGILVWFLVLLLPFLFITGIVTLTGDDAKHGYLLFTFLSALFWWGSHFILKEETEWYPNLLSKLPDCPKIKWNKGE